METDNIDERINSVSDCEEYHAFYIVDEAGSNATGYDFTMECSKCGATVNVRAESHQIEEPDED